MPFQTKAFIEASKSLDMNDKETRLTCTVINEAEQDELIRNITDKIYQKITMNITDIDFGSIPDSEGDITKIQNYELLVDALQDLEDLYTRYRQDLTQINVVKDAIENVKANKGLFIKAFAARADLPMMTYNTVVLSIVASVSFLISATIEFFIDPKTKNLNLAIDSAVLKGNSNDKLLLDNLVKFNKLCKDKNFNKFMNGLIQIKAKNLIGTSAVAVIGASIVIAVTIVPILRELVYFFYSCKTSISNYFEIQADLLEMNAARLDMEGNTDPKVARKQKELANKFRRFADKLSIQNKNASKEALYDVKDDEKEKYKIDDVTDSLPDSAASSLF